MYNGLYCVCVCVCVCVCACMCVCVYPLNKLGHYGCIMSKYNDSVCTQSTAHTHTL